MKLSPREKDKLLVSLAAMVARGRLERGVKLNHLISTRKADNSSVRKAGQDLGDQNSNTFASSIGAHSTTGRGFHKALDRSLDIS